MKKVAGLGGGGGGGGCGGGTADDPTAHLVGGELFPFPFASLVNFLNAAVRDAEKQVVLYYRY